MAESSIAKDGEGSSGATRLDPIVVTATRTRALVSDTPQTVQVFTKEEIEVREDAFVNDVLREATSLQVVQAGTPGAQTSVFIRGSNANQVLALIDGVQVNSATVGSFDFANLVPEAFERIEILRGGGGSLYGSEAIGGVINLITAKGRAPSGAALSGAGGNGSTDRETGTFSVGKGAFAAAGTVTHFGTGGFGPAAPTNQPPTEFRENDDFDATSASLRADWAATSTGSVYAIGHYIRSHLGVLNANIFNQLALDPNARQNEDFYFTKVGWEDAPVEGFSYNIDGAYVQDDFRYDDPPDVSTLSQTKSSIPTQIVQADAQANYAYAGWSITTAGFQFTRKSADVSSSYYDPSFDPPIDSVTDYDVSRNDYGVYGQEQIRLFDEALVLIGSLRYDHDSQFGDVTTPAANLAYRYRRSGTRLRASYAGGFRAPSFNELYFPDFGNPNLDPERSTEWNAGADQEFWDGRILLSATYFDRRVKDGIIGVFDPVTFAFQAENVGRIDTAGVEVPLTIDVGYGVTFGGSYTYTGITSHGGLGPVLRRPYNLMAAWVGYSTPALFAAADSFRARLDVFYVGDRPDVDPLTATIGTNPQYTRVDLAMTYRLPWRFEIMGFETFARISNLFDRSYDEVIGFPSAPVNALAGLRAIF